MVSAHTEQDSLTARTEQDSVSARNEQDFIPFRPELYAPSAHNEQDTSPIVIGRPRDVPVQSSSVIPLHSPDLCLRLLLMTCCRSTHI